MVHEVDKSGNAGLRSREPCSWDQVRNGGQAKLELVGGLMGPLGLPGM